VGKTSVEKDFTLLSVVLDAEDRTSLAEPVPGNLQSMSCEVRSRGPTLVKWNALDGKFVVGLTEISHPAHRFIS